MEQFKLWLLPLKQRLSKGAPPENQPFGKIIAISRRALYVWTEGNHRPEKRHANARMLAELLTQELRPEFIVSEEFYSTLTADTHTRLLSVFSAILPKKADDLSSFVATPQHALVVSYIRALLGNNVQFELTPQRGNAPDDHRRALINYLTTRASIPRDYLDYIAKEVGLGTGQNSTASSRPESSEDYSI